MARNIYRGGEAMDVINAGNAGWDDTQGRIDQLTAKRAGYRAAPRIAAGDYQGAAEEYGAAGMPDQALTMRQGREKAAAAAQGAAEHGQDRARAEALSRAEQLKEVATHAREVADESPEGLARRKEFVIGALQAKGHDLGMDLSDAIARAQAAPPDQYTDRAIAAFGAEIDKHTGVALGRGGYGDLNQRTGKFTELRAPEPTPERPTIVPNGATVLGPNGKPVFTNPKTFAPRKASGSQATAPSSGAPWLKYQGGRR